MNDITQIGRRRFLQYAGIGSLAAATLTPRWLFAEPGARYARNASPDFEPDVELEITATATLAPMMPGKQTSVWKYEGKLLKGPDGTAVPLPGTHLGSIFFLEKGQKVRIYFKNDLPEANIIHWHGLHVPQVMDGHPMYDVPAGSGYVYEFKVTNRAGCYMYHAHTHEKTGQQVYKGLAGLIIVTDPEEKALNLPKGEYDVPIVLQDRSFDADNQLRYVQNMRDRHMGFLGDEMIINGKRHFVLPVATRAYRLRLLNGSNSRIYKLGWEDGTPLTVIGTDGGLLDQPLKRPFVMLAPGERIDLWADFSERKVGTELVMKSLPFSGAMPGHGDGMGGGMGMGRGGMMEHGKDSDEGRGAGGGMMGMMNHGAENRGPGAEGGGRGMMGMMQHGSEGEKRESQGQGGHDMKGVMGGMMGGGGMMDHGGEGQSRAPTKPQSEGGHDMKGMMGGGMMEHGGDVRGQGGRGGEGEHGGMGMMSSSALPLGGEYPVFKVHIMREEPHPDSLPDRLSSIERLKREDAENPNNPRVIRISMAQMKWLLNGKEFEMNGAAPEETVKMDTLQVIEFDNGYSEGSGMGMGGGMMSGIPHPMHIHGQQFQILERKVREDRRKDYETIRPGFVDEGWKDVVLVLPGEKVTLLKRFDDFKGLFLYHCHNLEHEEMGMMRNFNVV